MVPADSQHIPRVRCYSGTSTTACAGFSCTGLSPTTATHPRSIPLTPHTTIRNPAEPLRQRPTTPTPQPLPGITQCRFSHHPLSLATTHGITQLFSLPMGTEMFHFPTFPPHTYFIQHAVTPHDGCWVSPFGHPRITARLTTPRGLSRSPTSFIGS